MSSEPAPVVSALAELAHSGQRRERARGLAARIGAEELAIFTVDDEVGIHLPAPGFPQTFPAGRRWRELLSRCTGLPGASSEGRLPFPGKDGEHLVRAFLAADRSVLALVGGHPKPGLVAEVLAGLPLLTRIFASERRVQNEHAAVALARAEAERAERLAVGLARSQTELHAAMAELSASDRRKDEFLAMLAHELRNPLAPLMTSVELLRRTERFDAGAVEVALRQTRRLSRLVDDLLDVSRVTRGMISLRRELLDVRESLEDAICAVRGSVDARRQSLTVGRPDVPLWVDGDRDRLQQVLGNLLLNASKFTPDGGSIHIELGADGDQVQIVVRDSGVGISQEFLPRIFQVFAQGSMSLDRREAGLGIGLALVQSLVRIHGGEVSARSDGPGRGSEFTVRLPRVTQAVLPARPSGAAAPSAPRERPTGARVLVIDDNVDAAQTLVEYFESEGHQAFMAHSGDVGLELAPTCAPDLILLDIGLPGLNGFEVARRLREAGSRAHLVALTGYGSESDRERSSEAGFDEHLLKPIGIEELDRLLKKVAER